MGVAENLSRFFCSAFKRGIAKKRNREQGERAAGESQSEKTAETRPDPDPDLTIYDTNQIIPGVIQYETSSIAKSKVSAMQRNHACCCRLLLLACSKAPNLVGRRL